MQKHLLLQKLVKHMKGKIKKVFKYIDAISKTGADAIKFQTHIAEEESTLDEPFRKNFNFKIKNRFEYWKSVEFSLDQWKKIKKYTEKKGIDIFNFGFFYQSCLYDEKNRHKSIKAWLR